MTTESYLTDYTPPTGRRPPPETVRRLREIVPEAELIYLGKGTWSLGTVRHNRLVHRASILTIEKIYEIMGAFGQGAFLLDEEDLKELHSRLQTMHLHRQGFRPIALYSFLGAPDGRIVNDLREREWRYQTQFEACIERSQHAMDTKRHLESKLESLQEYFRLEHKSIHRYAFRKAKHFVQAGLRKAKNLITGKAS